MTVNIALAPGNSAAANAVLPEYIHVNSPASAQSDLAAVAQAVARAKRIVVVCGLVSHPTHILLPRLIRSI